jgi:hypothetical protein
LSGFARCLVKLSKPVREKLGFKEIQKKLRLAILSALQNILAALDRGSQLTPRPPRPFASASDWPVATKSFLTVFWAFGALENRSRV